MNIFREYFAIMKRGVHSRWFLRSFFSLLLIVIILLGIFIEYVYSQYFTNVREQIMDELEMNVDYFMIDIEDEIHNMHKIVHSINQNDHFSYQPHMNIYQERIAIVQDLEKYNISNNFIHDIGFYRVNDQDTIFLTQGVQDLELFKSIYKFEDPLLPKLIGMKGNMLVVPMEPAEFLFQKENYVTFSFGLPFNSDNCSKIVFFLVNTERIDEKVKSIFGNSEGYLTIVDHSGNEIYSYFQRKDSERQQKTNDIEYIYVNKRSYVYKWNYTMAISERDKMALYYQKIDVLLLYIIFIVILMIMIAIFVAIYNYRPIYKLVKNTSDYSAYSLEENKDELKNIENIIVSIDASKRQLEKRLFVSNMVWGEYESEEDFYFDYNQFVVLNIKYEVRIIGDIQHNLPDIIEKLMNFTGCFAIASKLSCDDVITVILNFDKKIVDNGVPLLFERMKMFFQDKSIIFTICSGDTFDKLENIPISYEQARKALLFRENNSESSLITYDDVLRSKRIQFLNIFEDRLIFAFEDRNSSDVNKIMVEIEAYFKNNNHASEMAFLYHAILDVIDQYCIENKIEKNEEIRKISEMIYKAKSDFDQINIYIGDLSKRIASASDKDEEKSTELDEKIFKTIEEKLFDNTLSLESLAESCGITPSYLGRYFKYKMGITPMKYIDMKRMMKAKELLLNTEMKIKDIVSFCGYIDESNFIRKFKRNEGITPIRYREENKLEGENYGSIGDAE